MEKLSDIKRCNLLCNGVYKIINIINGKFYIGSCSSKGFLYERLKHHQQDLINNKHCNKYLQRAFNKYGIDNFYFEILELCNPKDCIVLEQSYIDLYKPEYNLQKIAGSSLGCSRGGKIGEKISKSNKEFWKNPENKSKMLVAFSKRVITKQRKKGYKLVNFKLNEEARQKIVERVSKKIINLDNGEIYFSLKEASNKLNINYTMLSQILNGKRHSKHNLKWMNRKIEISGSTI